MPTRSVFDLCRPRADVLAGTVAEADFAADLAQVVKGEASPEYTDPVRFFANTYPTEGLRRLLANVSRRLSGAGGEAAAIFRLDTSYGGGKTHGLIALVHAAGGMAGVSNIEEFIDRSLLPEGAVRIAAYDGGNADPANGRAMGDGVLAHTPWGEIAYALAGAAGYERVRASDEQRVAPGAETLRELFGGEPTLILIDELSVYLRKVWRRDDARPREQLTAFLTSLFQAVESAPNVALVYTLAIGRDGRATDAYSEENQFIADHMAEAESVSARKATLENPTEESEHAQVLRRRLFEHIDEAQIDAVLDDYRQLWLANADALPADARGGATADAFRASYPFHPELLDTLTEKAFTLASFQRIRGMLRLLARSIAHLWNTKPADATAIHLHHVDLGDEPIRQEIVTRLGQSAYVPAISNDIAGATPALAERLDADLHAGLPPHTGYVARTIFMHTLAFNEPLKGVAPERLRYSMMCPPLEPSFTEEARKVFIAESAYLDDRPGAPMRFLAEPNLTKLIQTEEQNVDATEARAHLDDRIREIFVGPVFEAVRFPGGPFDVPDEVADGNPKLVVLAYDGVSIGSTVERVPELIQRTYERKGVEGSALRSLRNNLVFVAAEDARKDAMRNRARRRLALAELKKPDRLAELAEHQKDKILELERKSESELAVAIQQCYRHVFYPSRDRLPHGTADLAHTAIDVPSSSDRPGAGQQQIVRVLRDLNKLRLAEDEPDSPAYVRDRTPLRKGQMTTLELRAEFRRDPTLPMLVGDDVFVRGIRNGIDAGEYVYRRDDLLYGPDDPVATIAIDAQATVLTMLYARNKGIWPRPKVDDEAHDDRATYPVGPTPEQPPGTPSTPDTTRPPQPTTGAITAEGLLAEALAKLWEQARDRKVAAIARLNIRLFEAGDAFRLLGAVGAVPGAKKTATFNGGYETRDSGTFQFEFAGPVPDAQPVREFLEPQLRDAAETDLEGAFDLEFANGLSLQGDAPEKMTERLARFASGAAYVTATAEAAD